MIDLSAANPADAVKMEEFEGIGEITVGGASSNWYIIAVALCLLNDPQVNKFMLANQLKVTDKIAKTKIFPRENMALPNGEVYKAPEKEEVLTLPDTEN
jgi:hypothetical protein